MKSTPCQTYSDTMANDANTEAARCTIPVPGQDAAANTVYNGFNYYISPNGQAVDPATALVSP